MLSTRRHSKHPSEYELLDFGAGRKLERFGSIILDRPSPAAEAFARSLAFDWSLAHGRVDTQGNIVSSRPIEPWKVRFSTLVFNLKLTPFGHVGLFPEQAANWCWLSDFVQQATRETATSQPRNGPQPTLVQQNKSLHLEGETTQTQPYTALNLFAYTGGTTLALAEAGASVVHVDASTPAVSWARHNAQASGLQQHPIRWIVEDARKFTQRELKRGNRYDIVVMDPPSYGHGPTGKPWILTDHLPELIHAAVSILRQDGSPRLLITAHCESPSPDDIVDMICQVKEPAGIVAGRLHLNDRMDRSLDAGFYVRAQF